jgi:hypothetical protein
VEVWKYGSVEDEIENVNTKNSCEGNKKNT